MKNQLTKTEQDGRRTSRSLFNRLFCSFYLLLTWRSRRRFRTLIEWAQENAIEIPPDIRAEYRAEKDWAELLEGKQKEKGGDK